MILIFLFVLISDHKMNLRAILHDSLSTKMSSKMDGLPFVWTPIRYIWFDSSETFFFSLCCFTQASLVVGFPGGSDSKESTHSAGDLGLIPDWKDPLEKGMATHSCILAWRIPWTEKPGRLQSTGPRRVGHD